MWKKHNDVGEHSIEEFISKDRNWAGFGKKNNSRYSISENSQVAPFVIGDRRNVIKEWNNIGDTFTRLD